MTDPTDPTIEGNQWDINFLQEFACCVKILLSTMIQLQMLKDGKKLKRF